MSEPLRSDLALAIVIDALIRWKPSPTLERDKTDAALFKLWDALEGAWVDEDPEGSSATKAGRELLDRARKVGVL